MKKLTDKQLKEYKNKKLTSKEIIDMKKRNVIKVDLSGCKNWNEARKVMEIISSGRVQIKVEKLKKYLGSNYVG